jgi:hypothetical protein
LPYHEPATPTTGKKDMTHLISSTLNEATLGGSDVGYRINL